MNNKEKLREFGKRLLLNLASQALPNSVQMAIEIAKDIHELWLSGHTQDLEALVEGAQALSVDEREALVRELTVNQPEAEPVARGMLETLRAGPTRGTITATLNQTLMQGTGQTLRPPRLSEGQRRVGAAVLSSMMLPRAAEEKAPPSSQWPRVPGYRLDRFLGAGAFAEVYAADELDDRGEIKRRVALKIGVLHNASRFKREVTALQAVDHPNLMDYFSSGVLQNPHPPRFWIAMPPLSGLTLRDLLKQGLDDEQKLLFAGQILEGLVALHGANLSHRDLKPENALIGDDFQLKLTDFGLSKQRRIDSQASTYATQAGEMLGTPAYMSPEQVEGQDQIGAEADIWAFGALLYELFVGHPPFDGKTIGVIFGAILHSSPDLRVHPIPPPLYEVLERCVNRDLRQRYPNATALGQDLRPIAAELLKKWRHERFRAGWMTVFEGRLLQRFAESAQGRLPEFPVEAFLAVNPGLPELDLERLAAVLPMVFAAQAEVEAVRAQRRALNAVNWAAEAAQAEAEAVARLGLRDMQEAIRRAGEVEAAKQAAQVHIEGRRAQVRVALAEAQAALEQGVAALDEALRSALHEELLDFEQLVAERQARAEAQAWAEAKAKARARAKAEAQAWAKAEARAKAEAEARAKAEAQARALAEAEALALAEAEALALAEAEARAERRRKRWAWALAALLLLLLLFILDLATKPDELRAEFQNKEEIDWIEIKGRFFEMGSDNGENDEKPVHTVRVDDFWIGKTEVTVKQYRACVVAGACSEPSTGGYCNWGQSGREDHPINCVDWDQAKAFATWAGGRLPSEAEWEYVARSQGREREYPWGDAQATCEYAVMSDGGDGCGQDRTWPVCSKPRGNTEQGVCDMSGNVWEWVADYYGSYDSTPRDGTEHLKGSSRVVRGGSWSRDAGHARAAARNRWAPSNRSIDLGFRLVRTPR
ncbi:SUMF1/EgtB/PvdO family nonheme iron enzyme [Myxococcota bacterium]|nr:SUMF1/EgtB/PvdO family nonheme iron enzyme [Myxococcota bacterium]